MDASEFREHGKDMVDYICRYLTTLQYKRVTPSVEPGYLRECLPDAAPDHPEPWHAIMSDVENKIMPGMTHWQHPKFFAYFPSGVSYPSIMADMLSDALSCVGFSWAASPACTELETIVLDWLGKAIGLPPQFLSYEKGSKGGGCMQGSASESILVTMLAARANAIKRLKFQYPNVDDGVLLTKLIAYCSKEAHSGVEKAAMISFVKLRILPPDDKESLRGDVLEQAMEEDVEAGRVPFFVSTTIGTTSCASVDNIPEIGAICKRYPSVWLHVDAAYAGSAMICPELKYLLNGIEYADSFNTNGNKWLLCNFDSCFMWVRDKYVLTSALVVDPLYLQHGYDKTAIDYRHWGIPLSRRFRSLKLWFVMRTYGISGLQHYIRHHINLAKYFEKLCSKDKRFEICNDVKLGLVCFRLKGREGVTLEDVNQLNKTLLSNINASGRMHMVPASLHERFIIRFCVCAEHAKREDIEDAWSIINEFATELLEEGDAQIQELKETKRDSTLARKRSFFVRMVSDPKIYNPAIANTVAVPTSPGSPEHVTLEPPSPSSPNSWISWPLQFFFQSVDHDSSKNLPIRFRHLDTRVQLKNPGAGALARRGSTPSPERRASDASSPSRFIPALLSPQHS